MESEKPRLVPVAEDTVSAEKSVEDILKSRGYVSASFQDSYRALEHLSINGDRVDLIIVDTEIADTGGVEMARRAVAMNLRISVILIYDRGQGTSSLCPISGSRSRRPHQRMNLCRRWRVSLRSTACYRRGEGTNRGHDSSPLSSSMIA